MGSTFSPELIGRATDMYFEELKTQQNIAEELDGPSQATISRWIRSDPRCAIARKGRGASIFHATSDTRGYRYVTNELGYGDDPVVVSEKVVRRIMSERGLSVIYVKKKRVYGSYKGEMTDALENLVDRDFHADAPNKLWLTDITRFTLPGFRCYLSPVIDCFDGKVVARRMSLHPSALLANTMLKDAVATLAEGEHPTCRSDRGCHYRWPGWIRICEEAGITRSMSNQFCERVLTVPIRRRLKPLFPEAGIKFIKA